MKKTILSVFVLTAVLAVTIFSSCQKIEQASPVVVTDSLTGTITGMIEAQLEQDTTTTVWEKAPSGTKVFLKIALNELNPQAPAGEHMIYSTTVDASGNYTFTVPTNATGVQGTIVLDEFVYDKKMWEWNWEDNKWVSSTERTEYASQERDVTVVYGQTKIEDFQY